MQMILNGSRRFNGKFGPGMSGIPWNVTPGSAMTGPAGFQPSWWRTSCISSQSPMTWCWIPWPGAGCAQTPANDRKGTWAVKASGNWRVTFKFQDEDAFDIDYEDYH